MEVDKNKQVVHSRPAVEAQWSLVASPKDTLKMRSDVALGEESAGRWDLDLNLPYDLWCGNYCPG